ncbi:MAG: NAD(+) synthase [Muribaculaceae bacterium]|nr:NAD(+) synthase [Muribaculaceae bacterium]
MKNGFARIAAVSSSVNVADVDFNVARIIESMTRLAAEEVDLSVFPEMSLTGYTCGDLFLSTPLVEAAAGALKQVAEASGQLGVDVIVGLPVRLDGTLYNCAAIVRGCQVDLIPKTYIPNYSEFYECRWWHSTPRPAAPVDIAICPGLQAVFHSRPTVVECRGLKVGVEICEDLWTPMPPSSRLAMAGATVIANLSASDDLIGKYHYLTSLISQQSARCLAAYVYAGAGFGESSTDLVFDGKAIIAENGRIIDSAPRWTDGPKTVIADVDIAALEADRRRITTFADCARREVDPLAIDICPDERQLREQTNPLKYRQIDPRPFVPADDAAINERCAEITGIQIAGLARRLSFINCRSLVVGISGGLDSTLALLVAVAAFDRLGFDRKGITGVTMPGFGTTDRTHSNAVTLMETLGVSIREISIAPAVTQHFSDIGHDPAVHDVTYENSQARYRTMLLMDLANRLNGIVLGTGDLSELALGWATYNGDHISMYGVNAGVPKTLVRYLVRHFALSATDPRLVATLTDIIDTPISPELIPPEPDGTIKQKTEDLVGPYELHDFFLYYLLRYGFAPRRVFEMAVKAFDGVHDRATILHWMKTFYRRFFAQQFKRSCMPDGPKVGSVCLSPRGDWRMPSDASSALWLRDLATLE